MEPFGRRCAAHLLSITTMNTINHTLSPQHFLFMLPDSATPADHEQIVNAARELSAHGYVYVASAHERAMQDRENIRFMPLRRDDLPRFGAATSVMIVKDRGMVTAAEQAYPGAHVLVIDSSDASSVVDYVQRTAQGVPSLAA